jgi:hypothetical protein
MRDEANPKYLEALAFAVERHGAVRQVRKGAEYPYVVHPIRVGEILNRFKLSEDVVVAGILHDTVEDAAVSYGELTREFGTRVAALVEKVSEPDKSLDWPARKQHAIDRAATESDLDALAIVAADKLDNVLSLQETLRSLGDKKTWSIFNADRKSQHWYYRALAETLLEREPTNLLFRTLDAEVHKVFPDERRETRFFAGKPLGNTQDARAYLADPIKHWRPKYSAFELATAWLGADGIPPKVESLLRTAFGAHEIVEGFFEKQTKLDDFGRPSQTDLLLFLRVSAGFAVVGVEAKAKETFGPIVSEWGGNPHRLDDLCKRLGLHPENVQDLRYQLLHRTVAVLLETEKYGASDAVMLVHSFDPDDASLEDYRAFAKCLGLSDADPDKLTSSTQLDGITLQLGWVKQR